MLHKSTKKKFILEIETALADLTPLTLTIDLVTPMLLGFLCYQEWMCGPSLRRVGQGILYLLNGNSVGTFDPDDLDL